MICFCSSRSITLWPHRRSHSKKWETALFLHNLSINHFSINILRRSGSVFIRFHCLSDDRMVFLAYIFRCDERETIFFRRISPKPHIHCNQPRGKSNEFIFYDNASRHTERTINNGPLSLHLVSKRPASKPESESIIQSIDWNWKNCFCAH